MITDDNVLNHAHPAACGMLLSSMLPWDHVTNIIWAVVGSVTSWASVQLLTWVWLRWKAKRL